MKGDYRNRSILFVLGVTFLALLIFRSFLDGTKVLLSTDAFIIGGSVPPGEILHRIFASWNNRPLLGFPGGTVTKIPPLLLLVIRGVAWNNCVYALACLFSSLVFLHVFRRNRMGSAAIALGAITAFWLGSNFTLLYAGHVLKPYVVLFFVASLVVSSRLETMPLCKGVLTGTCIGLMFVHQPDVAMFFALFSGAYLVFRIWHAHGWKPLLWLRVLAPAMAVAFLFAAGPLLTGYRQHVKGAAQMQTENKQDKWNYVTQWSWPPEESIAFIAPGYTGWRSGEPDGPYWGRMGRSPGWEKTGQGFRNFKLESTYLGFIPVAFALFALFSARASRHRAEIIFWGTAALLALLLAFGKFSPLYSLFFRLPVVNSIRNPNKFLQVFQVCLAILAVYGLDALPGEGFPAAGQNVKGAHYPRRFFWVVLSAMAILLLGAGILSVSRAADVASFTAKGWPEDAAQVMVRNKITALSHAALMAGITAVAFSVFAFDRFKKALRFRNWMAIGLALTVAVDAVVLSKHYVKEMPRSYIRANALTDFLKKNIGYQRVAFLNQQGIYNLKLTYLLPFNRILPFNFSDMPRMPQDYMTFLTAASRAPLDMWRFSGVKYLLAPSSVEKDLTARNGRKVFAYDLYQAPDGGYGVSPAPAGPFAVYELLGALPRYGLWAGSEKVGDETVLSRFGSTNMRFGRVCLPPDSPLPLLEGEGQTGKVEVGSYRPERIVLKTASAVPTILRCAERYDPDWTARIDGTPAQVGRVDFLCQGVAVPAGEHTVELRYAPSRVFLYMQCFGFALCMAAAGIVVLRKRRERGAVSDAGGRGLSSRPNSGDSHG